MPWAKGQSGNPGGRPKGYAELEALARSHTKAAINALVRSLHDERLAVAAAVALLNRGWGKPHESVKIEGMPNPVLVVPQPIVEAFKKMRGEK